MAFRVAAAQCRRICPEWLNWPGWLVGKVPQKGHVEFQNNFFLTTFHHHFKPKMVISRLKILVTYSCKVVWPKEEKKIVCTKSSLPCILSMISEIVDNTCEQIGFRQIEQGVEHINTTVV